MNISDRDVWRRRVPYIAATILVFAFFAVFYAVLLNDDSALSRGVTGTFGDPERQWGFTALFLLITLPIGATMVVFVRMILGLQTFGLFTPMLLSLAYLQTGPVLGPAISIGAILIGMMAAPLLKALHLARVAFLGTLISVVVAALVTLDLFSAENILVAAFPVVVTALVVERWWAAWEAEGLRKALRIALYTLLVSIAIESVVANNVVRNIAQSAPIALPICCAILMVLMGRYTGLRVSEIKRFRSARDGERTIRRDREREDRAEREAATL